LALTPDEKSGIDDATEMEQAADKILDRAHTRFIVSNDPDEVVEKIAPYVQVGFSHLIFHGPGNDQERFLRGFCTDVLPKLHDRFGTGDASSILTTAAS
jgi:coenzyme F420-dependent glucose-6-phosphate dehydrogenase